jgi:hypothetical protein
MPRLRIIWIDMLPRRSALLNVKQIDKSRTGRRLARAGACVATKNPLTGELQ